MLTGDPDGLASALTRLEKAQGRIWESMMLPGGRIPDPSILRTHPLTAERVARLMALKAAPGGPDGSGPGAAPQQRPSLVPKIRPRLPHGATGAHALMADAGAPAIDDSFPACDAPLNPPHGDPRLRLTRGGVWW
jgi:heat shock protein HtpX